MKLLIRLARRTSPDRTDQNMRDVTAGQVPRRWGSRSHNRGAGGGRGDPV